MAYRSVSIGTPANDTTHTVPVPSGLADGDKVNIFFVEESTRTAHSTIPTGFALDATEADTVSDFRAVNIRRFWKDITNAAGEGSGGNYTITFGSAAIGYAMAVAHSGCATGAGTDANTNDGASAASPLSVALTGVTAASGDDVIAFWAVAPDDGADPFNITSSNTPPSSYTARQDFNTYWRIGELATRDNVSSGATGTLTASCTFTEAATANFCGLVVTMAASGGGGGSNANLFGGKLAGLLRGKL